MKYIWKYDQHIPHSNQLRSYKSITAYCNPFTNYQHLSADYCHPPSLLPILLSPTAVPLLRKGTILPYEASSGTWRNCDESSLPTPPRCHNCARRGRAVLCDTLNVHAEMIVKFSKSMVIAMCFVNKKRYKNLNFPVQNTCVFHLQTETKF